MKDIHCESCKLLLFRASEDFTGRIDVRCRKCHHLNKVRSWPGGYVGVVCLDKEGDFHRHVMQPPGG